MTRWLVTRLILRIDTRRLRCFSGSTAKHALEHGFRTIVIDNACRGVTVADIDNTKEQLSKLGAIFVDSSEVSENIDQFQKVMENSRTGYQI